MDFMWRHASGIAVIAGLLSLPMPTQLLAQAPAQRTEAEIQAERDAQGYTPVRLWERPDVRATRVEIKPMATRAPFINMTTSSSTCSYPSPESCN
jgi:hypothetical protein